ncbi:MAG: hypothetical protein K6G33_04635, partial [Ruminococcus sp.]|nr:hypothetical protein [Ruminococcus sp.]
MTVEEFIEELDKLSSKKKKSDYVNSLSEAERKSIFENLTPTQRADIMNKDVLTARAQNNLFTAADVKVRREYINSLGSEEAVKTFRNSIRDYAVEDFWNNERELIKQGKGTYNWTPDQQREILNIVDGVEQPNAGRPKNLTTGETFQGHHMLDAHDFPEYAGDYRNIQPVDGDALTKTSSHYAAHGGNPSNTTKGYYDDALKSMTDFSTSNLDDGYPPKIELTDPCKEVKTMESFKNAEHTNFSEKIPFYDSLDDEGKIIAQRMEYVRAQQGKGNSDIPDNFMDYLIESDAGKKFKSSDGYGEKASSKLMNEMSESGQKIVSEYARNNSEKLLADLGEEEKAFTFFDSKGNKVGQSYEGTKLGKYIESEVPGEYEFKLSQAEAKNYNLDKHADELEMIMRYGDEYKNASPREKLDFKELNYLSGSLNECKNEAKVLEAAAKYIEGSGKTAESLNAVDKALINFCANANLGKVADLGFVKKANGFLEAAQKSGKLAKFSSAASKIGNVAMGVTIAVQSGIAIYNAAKALDEGKPFTAGSYIVGAGANMAITFIGGEALTGAIAPYLMGLGMAVGGPVGALVGGLLAGVIGYGVAGLIGGAADKLIQKLGGWLDSLFGDACEANPPRDPLVVDLGAVGIELNSVVNGVHFDLDKNGFAEKTGWIGKEDGFLALDRNENGFIDDGGELFSDQVALKNGEVSKSGFEALAELDDNVDEETGKVGDGVIDANDSEFENLRVWIDENQNGISEENELKTLDELGITSISLDHSDKNIVDEETRTMVTESANVSFKDGSQRDISEHWFEAKTYDTVERDGNGQTIHSDSIESFGNVRNLASAIKDDETGLLGKLVDEFQTSNSYLEKRVIIKKILFRMTNSEEILPDSRGGNIDARELNVVEQFMGRGFIGTEGSSTPNSSAASILKRLYNNIETTYFNLLNKETAVGDYLRFIYVKEDEEGNKTLDFSLFRFVIDNQIAQGEDVDDIVIGVGSWLQTYDYTNSYDALSKYEADLSEKYEQYSNLKDMIVNTNVIIGGDENDTLNGNSGSDYIEGGKGDDVLYGKAGNDAYVYTKGDGNDVIFDNSGVNKIVFKDLRTSDVYVVYPSSGYDAVLHVIETGETITIQDFRYSSSYRNFTLVFEDKTVGVAEAGSPFLDVRGTDADETIPMFFGGGTANGYEGDDIINGTGGNDNIYGGAGDDTLNGNGGDDTLDGSIGSDSLNGGAGNNTYIYGKGYGNDVLFDNSGKNRIVFKDLKSTDVYVVYPSSGYDAILHVIETGETLTIQDFRYSSSYRDFKLIFEDKVVDVAEEGSPFLDIRGTDEKETIPMFFGGGSAYGYKGDDIIHGTGGNDYISGGTGNDTLNGNGGADTIDGGTGNDGLYGGAGNDTYIYGKDYGKDVL